MYSLVNQIRLFTAFMIVVWIMMIGITIDNNSKVALFTKERQRISDANRGVWIVTTNIAEQAALLESYIQTGDGEINNHFKQLFNDYKNGMRLAKINLPPDDAVTLDGINSAFEQWINNPHV